MTELGRFLSRDGADTRYVQTLRPTGDATGAGDRALINAALIVGDATLRGDFVVDSSVLMPSSRTLTLHNAQISMVVGGATNVVRNSNQDVTGNTGIHVVGIGRAIIRCADPANMPVGSAINSIGVSWVNAGDVCVEGVTLGPMRGPAMVAQGVTGARFQRIHLAQDHSVTNQDGIDIGPQSSDVLITDISGKTGDDAFSIFAQKTAGFVHTMYKATFGVAGISNITIKRVKVDVGNNPVRVQAGDGLTLNGVRVTDFTNLADGTHTPNQYAVVMFGESTYVTTLPASTDLTNVTMGGYTGRASAMLGACTNFSKVKFADTTITSPWKCLMGIPQAAANFAATCDDIDLGDVVTTDSTTESVGTVLNAPSSSSWGTVALGRLNIRRCQNILNNNATLRVIATAGIFVRNLVGQIARSSAPDTGFMDNVRLGNAPATLFAVASTQLLLGPNMPPLTSTDTTPSASVKGSQITCRAGKDPTGGSATNGGTYIARGNSSVDWVKIADLGASY